MRGLATGAGDKGLAPNPLMRGMAGGEYVRSAVATVKPGELEAALLCLPFADALRLLPRLASWLASGVQVGTSAAYQRCYSTDVTPVGS
jgi:hypothetical protein